MVKEGGNRMELVTGKTGLPHVQAADDAELYRLFLGDGAYVLPTGLQLEAQLYGANKIRIFDGSLIVQGRLAKIRTSTGFDELDLAPGVIGQKRVDLVVAEYSKVQEETIDAWIVGDSPLAIDWLSETEGGTAFTPVKGQLYKLMNTVQTYEEGTYYRWHGNVYVRSLVQELEHCETKIIQGSYNTSTYIEPTITEGNIDLGQTHQVKLWAVKFNGLNVEEQLTDYRNFLTDTPYNTLISTTLQAQAQAQRLIQDMLSQVNTAMDTLTEETSERIEELRRVVKIAPLTTLIAHDVTTQAVTGGYAVSVPKMGYVYSSLDVFVPYLNGLKIPIDQYDISDNGDNINLTCDFFVSGGTYADVEIEVWRPEE